jgi:hypothetical protein
MRGATATTIVPASAAVKTMTRKELVSITLAAGASCLPAPAR